MGTQWGCLDSSFGLLFQLCLSCQGLGAAMAASDLDADQATWYNLF